ncbi:PD-(D/E)XK nuclease family protein [Streptomyces sp. NPDC005918]|uniref:RecB family exonuclease n=1 Tax=Streptomyces sp. NPDC005918 TaxID=3155454 RepID=UPI0033E9283A
MSDSDHYSRWATMPRSVSQVTEFEDCPYKAFLKRVKRVVPRPAAWSTHGTAFHSAAEAFEKSGRAMTAEQAVEVFQDEYSKGINRDLGEVNDPDQWMRANRGDGADDIEERFHKGTEQTRRYVEYVQDQAPVLWYVDGQPAIELYFMADFGGVKVRGYIDQVLKNKDDTNRVRDLKTGSTKSKFQLWVYEMALNQLYPDQETTNGDWYLAKEHRPTRPVKLGDANQDEITQRIVSMDEAVKGGDFPARPGFLCRFCDVSYACLFFRS